MTHLRRLAPRAFLLLLAAACLCVASVTASSVRTLSVVFVDVGQGDCVVTRLPGGQTVLVDAGDERAGPRVLAFLLSKGIRRLDVVVATHPHADHVGGFPDVLRGVAVTRAIHNGQQPPGVSVTRFFDILAELGIPAVTASPALLIDQAGATVRVLWPTQVAAVAWGANNASVVLRVQFGSIVFLLTGDIEERAESALLAGGRPALDCDVLKVPHHGSRTGTSQEFLSATTPAVAIICVGRGNLYGHPHREALERLAGAGARVYRTDLAGTITVSTDGRQLSVKTTHVPADSTKG